MMASLDFQAGHTWRSGSKGECLCQKCGVVPTEAPTILLANRNRPVVQPIGLLAIGPAYSPSYVRLHRLANGLPH
jgi:hypothetical protein